MVKNIEYWKTKLGCSVVLTIEMKSLIKGTIGKLDKVVQGISEPFAIVIFESNKNSNKVYACSVYLHEIKIVE